MQTIIPFRPVDFYGYICNIITEQEYEIYKEYVLNINNILIIPCYDRTFYKNYYVLITNYESDYKIKNGYAQYNPNNFNQYQTFRRLHENIILSLIKFYNKELKTDNKELETQNKELEIKLEKLKIKLTNLKLKITNLVYNNKELLIILFKLSIILFKLWT